MENDFVVLAGKISPSPPVMGHLSLHCDLLKQKSSAMGSTGKTRAIIISIDAAPLSLYIYSSQLNAASSGMVQALSLSVVRRHPGNSLTSEELTEVQVNKAG